MLVLVLNCGSSSVKVSLEDTTSGGWCARGSVDRVGSSEEAGTRRMRVGGAPEIVEEAVHPGYREAISWLVDQMPADVRPAAIGHRVVHGGERYTQPAWIDRAMLAELEDVSRLAPLHNPPNLAGIRIAAELYPHLPQVAAFDTAFHATLPDFAYRYAVPCRFYQAHGIRRYGFHGLSHRYVSERASAMLGGGDLRLVTLHLGNGCSAAAVRAGRSVDTSMGMTPLEGLVMGTRSGDLDPAVPLILEREQGLGADEVNALLNRESGLKALSGGCQDMRDLEEAVKAGDPAARLAFDTFCYRARKYVGAYAASMGGLNAVVFTAGIGENSAGVRTAVCAGLEFLGLRLDARRNGEKGAGERDVSSEGAPARVLVIPTNEEMIIAGDTERVLLGR
jgi:acetate kinase